MRKLKLSVLFLSKYLGLFAFSRYLYRKNLQILCYHSLSFEDEYEFQPKLCMRPVKFRGRMAFLKKNGYSVVSLQDGLDQLAGGTIQKKTVIITFDDGFHSFFKLAKPILLEYGFPATVYVTSYYVNHRNPIFRLAVRYMLWKSGKTREMLLSLISDIPHVDFGENDDIASMMWKVIHFAEANMEEDERLALGEMLGERLGVSYQDIAQKRLWHIMSPEELANIAGDGFDVQLHTHRHNFPIAHDEAIDEIEKNRKVLEPIVGKKLTHFCYPSGIWDKQHWDILNELGCGSATTCEPLMNSSKTPLYALGRFLDADDFSMLEFEAELSGFKHLARSVLRFLKNPHHTC